MINNREIKFRIWDKIDLDWISNRKDQVMILGMFVFPDTICIGRNNFCVQQFTGLKDKNNIDIYEGDILKTRLGNSDVIFEEYHGGMSFKLRNSSFGYEGEDLIYIECFELVGNIFENKDLLK